MITVIIFLALGGLLGVLYAIKENRKHGYNDIEGCFIMGMIGLMLGCIPAIILAATLPVDLENKSYKVKIKCLSDNSSVSGRFFLGSGQIDGTMSYSYYAKYGDGYKMYITDYRDAIIKYCDGAPFVEVRYKEKTDSWINSFSFSRRTKSTYVFNIPKGSIKQSYHLDAE